MAGEVLGFQHRYVPSHSAKEPFTLLLLHGTGGDEADLLPLGRALRPDAALLSPRGKVLENGMSRFFRRHAEGVLDLEDLAARTEELAEFVLAASRAYGFDPSRIVACGFSNGANIGSSLLLRRPDLLRGAILLRPVLFPPPALPAPPVPGKQAPRLSAKRVLIAAGLADPLIPPGDPDRLAELFRELGAEVDLHREPGGHQLAEGDLRASRRWLERFPGLSAERG